MELLETAPLVEAPVTGRRRFLHRIENVLLAVGLLGMAILPIIEFAGRRLIHAGIPGATDYIQHLTLWVAFIGAMAATRDGRHLQMAASMNWLPRAVRPYVQALSAAVCAAVTTALCGGSIGLVVAEGLCLPPAAAKFVPSVIARWLEPLGLFQQQGGNTMIAGWLPIWVAESLMVVGFAVITVRFILGAGRGILPRLFAALGVVGTILLSLYSAPFAGRLVVPGLAILVAATVVGAPIFILLGGAAVVLFWGEGVTLSSIPSEAYRIVASPFLPTIPIFTLTGYILSGGRASERLVRVFRAWFGWIPGGTAVAATILCAFFTTFTGASGVTILAVGGLLLPVLVESGFKRRFSVGLLTATGSIGLLFPPSLIVILYGVVAGVSILDLFKAAFVPGILLMLPVCVLCMIYGYRTRAGRTAFRAKEALAALAAAKWEVLLPVLVLVLVFGGFCSFIESAAFTVVYALVVEMLVYRDLKPRALYYLLVKCGILVGGILIILGVGMGLTSYLVDAQIPMQAADWAREHLHSRWVFLLALNGVLILVGCVMNIFSALVVMVPLILPMAKAFGVDPVHVGIIFMANLELGYLAPPAGMNLFFASFRFDEPLLKVARDALPFLLLMAGAVLLITYVPAFTVGVLELLR
jgi:C4-dicarboxylate transporter, DctM subunit